MSLIVQGGKVNMKTIINGRLIAQGPLQDFDTDMVFFEFSFWQDGNHRDDAEVVANAIVLPAPMYEDMMHSDLGTELLAQFLSHVTGETVNKMRSMGRSCTDIILVDPQGHDTDTMQIDND